MSYIYTADQFSIDYCGTETWDWECKSHIIREIYAETERPLSILAVLASLPVVYLVLCCAEGDIVSGSVYMFPCLPP